MDNDGTPLESQAPECPAGNEPEQSLARRQLWLALLQCLRSLPVRTADTFVLREFLGMNTAETCRELAVSETHCAVMLHRARARIRESLDRDWVAP